ncbi:hypothetical protein LJR219_002265 [Phenylobacterium sp. LjRoot219]|uniref:hypothetical protein n=1 Tax=Phenylobacterium sp. LjRoot219 TaxID=3342283 RepID=UPI003ECDA473
MNKLPRILLLVGGLVLVLLVGVLIGRGQHAAPTSEPSTPATVQITTAPPPAPPPPPLPAPVQAPAPPPAAIPTIAPDLQVQEDAAAVGMTTLEAAEVDPATTPASTDANEPVAPQPQG